MKVLSYSRMRAELADVLDCLRNGEIVTITQKGKDDLILYSDNGQAKINTRLTGSSGVASAVEMADKLDRLPGGGVKMSEYNTFDKGYTLKRIKEVEKLNPALKKKGSGLSFEEAKKKVIERHADVIKGLENN
ncbi:hypothetical protein ABVL59_004778 [Salmonella enterica]|nr:hypothetical protein [Salmonella enterica]EDU5438969.1 hypothetical protein [Salmonella enterica subsp. enterica serovar Hadar]EEE1370019.1 hypothetical protein [Salmonella enterica subsp. enterica serovar Durban]EBA2275999.1 hypothetical protein [Salmonella enterica]EBD0681902.1 hypothetical protein [Salmonella enterica]